MAMTSANNLFSDIPPEFKSVIHHSFQSLKDLKQPSILRNIRHILCVLSKSYGAFLIDDKQRRHSSQFYQVPFLTVELSQCSFRIRNTNIGEVFFFPVAFGFLRSVRNYHDYLSFPVRKFLDVLFHLPQMLSGKRSTETPQKYKHDRAFLVQARERNSSAVNIFCREFWRNRSNIQFHISLPLYTGA